MAESVQGSGGIHRGVGCRGKGDSGRADRDGDTCVINDAAGKACGRLIACPCRHRRSLGQSGCRGATCIYGADNGTGFMYCREP